MERVRWGILGCGNIATTAFAPAIRWARNGLLVAVGSRSAERARAKAQEVGAARAHGDYASLLADPEVEAIYIGLPNGEHARWAIAAAEAGKHVLCDKSLALTVDDARAMRQAFAARGLRLVEAFMVRHHPQWDLVRGLLREGRIGPIRSLRAWFGGRQQNPADHRWSRELGGGALFDVTCYGVNVARMVTGEEPRRVQATARWRNPGADESTFALLEFPGGAIAQVAGSLSSPFEQGVVVVGNGGRIVVEKPFVPGWDPVEVMVETEGARELLRVNGANHFLHLVEHFGHLVRDPAAALAPAEDGVANVTACVAVAAAAAANVT